jgi:hypothetical protein
MRGATMKVLDRSHPQGNRPFRIRMSYLAWAVTITFPPDGTGLHRTSGFNQGRLLPCGCRRVCGAQVSPDGHVSGALVVKIEASNNFVVTGHPSSSDHHGLPRQASAIWPRLRGLRVEAPPRTSFGMYWMCFMDAHTQHLTVLRNGVGRQNSHRPSVFHRTAYREIGAQQSIDRPSRSTGHRSTEAMKSGPFLFS